MNRLNVLKFKIWACALLIVFTFTGIIPVSLQPVFAESELRVYTRDFNDSETATDGFKFAHGNGSASFEAGDGVLKVTTTSNTFFIDNNSPEFDNGIFEVKVKTSVNSGRFGLVVKYSDASNWLLVGYDAGNWGYETPAGWNYSYSGPSFVSGSQYTLKVKYLGNIVTLWVNGDEIFTDEVSGVPENPGKIGFRSWYDTKTLEIDDIYYEELEYAEEPTPEEPTTEPNITTIESDKLEVSIDEIFPRVEQYKWKETGDILYGQEDPIYGIKINGILLYPDVSFDKKASNEALYTLTFDYENKVREIYFDFTMQIRIKVEGNKLYFDIINVDDSYSLTKVNYIEIPNHNIVSVRSTQSGAALAAARMYTSTSGSGDTFLDLTKYTQVDSSPVGYMYAFLNTDKLSAGVWTNSVYDYPGGNTANDNFRVQKQTISKDGYYRTGLWSGNWVYRADGMTEPEPDLPSMKIAITPDINNDNIVDWQDGAVAFREIMNNPMGWEKIADLVVQRIPFNFASQATNPFLRVLDETKRVYLATDGLGQNVLLKGYQSEGHDSAHPDYGAIGQRQGGADELAMLVEEGHKYNAEFGVHINATESYPEAKSFSEELVNPNSLGWDWLDPSYYIKRRNDAISGNRLARLEELYNQVPGLDFVYVDVWYRDGWESRKIAREINSFGWRLETEFPQSMEYDVTWTHWAVDYSYGSVTGFNSMIARFLRNHQKDNWIARDPLLMGIEMADYEGWQGRTDFDNTIYMAFSNGVPTKYMQKFPIIRWTNNQIDFEENVSVSNATGERIITKDGREVLRGDKYLLPWNNPGEDVQAESKLYHWNKKGGTSTWTLPVSWEGVKTVKLYKLTYQGRKFVGELEVIDNKITITADSAVPYVVVKGEEGEWKPVSDMKWGEGTPVKDPGFNAGSLQYWNVEGEGASVELNDKGQYELKIGAGDGAVVSQVITGLSEGTYAASVNVNVNGKRKAIIGVKDYGGPEVTNYTESSIAYNYILGDTKNGTYTQRMRVLFDVPEGQTTATLYLKAEEGTGIVAFDDVRVVKTKRTPNPTGAYFVEDFENVDHGLYPFVKGPAGGINDPRTHLSELHEPYTQKGWNGKAIDDVLNGNWSLKIHKESTGLIIRTIPQTLRFEPGKLYRVSFTYQSELDKSHAFVIGEGNKEISVKSIPAADENTIFSKAFQAGETGETWIGIKVLGGSGDFVLDDLIVEEIDDLEPDDIEFTPVDLSAIPQSGMTATATSEEIAYGDLASNAIDGDTGTMWHTAWSGADKLPQSITIDLGGTYVINKVEVTPRQSGNNGLITKYELSVSNDGINFTRIASGNWTYSDRNPKTLTFNDTEASHIRITALEGQGGFASISEINVYRRPLTIVGVVGGSSFAVTTEAGKMPVLPGKAKVELSDGSIMELPVKWNWVKKEYYANPGTFEVTGYVNGSNVEVKAIVTVTGDTTDTVEATLKGPDKIGISSDFTVVYGVKNAENITAQDITISYDADKFEFIEAKEAKSGLSVATDTKSISGSKRIIVFSLGKENAVNGTADILNIKFTSKDQTGNGEIAVAEAIASDYDGNRYELITQNARMTVTVLNENTEKATLSGPESVMLNNEFEVVYGIENVESITVQNVTVEFDNEKFEFIKAETADSRIAVIDEVTRIEDGKVRLVVVSLGEEGAISGKADILKLTFKAKGVTENSFIRVSKVELADGQGNEFTADTNDAVLNVKVIADSPAMTISGTKVVEPGEEFDVTLGVQKAESVFAFEFTVTYDSDRFEYVGSRSLSSNYNISERTYEGKIKFVGAVLGEENAVNGNADLLKITFKAKNAPGQGTIAVSNAVLANGDGQEFAAEEAKITIAVGEVVVDKSVLAQKISYAQGLNPEDYTAASWAILRNALENAIAVNNNPKANQNEVNNAVDLLQSAINGLVRIEVVEEVRVNTYVNMAPQLPEKVKVKFADGSVAELHVAWDETDPKEYGTPGNTFTVFGTVEGIKIKAKAIVTVVQIGDLDKDGQFDIDDLCIAGMHYGKSKGDGCNWDLVKIADFDNNGKINIADLNWLVNKIEENYMND